MERYYLVMRVDLKFYKKFNFFLQIFINLIIIYHNENIIINCCKTNDITNDVLSTYKLLKSYWSDLKSINDYVIEI